MNELKLSILIPTYNRARYLEECLKSIINSYKNDDIEIIVSDNCSDDDTELVVKNYSSDSRIRYFRNKENIGSERNYLSLLEKARAKYIFFLTDDDQVKPQAISKIINLIDNSNYGIIMGGYEDFDDDKKECININIKHKEFKSFEKGEDGLINLFSLSHILSGIIVRRDCIDLAEFRSTIGTMYCQMFLVGSVLNKTTSCYLPEVIVIHRVNNQLFWSLSNDYNARKILDIIEKVCQGEKLKKAKGILISQRAKETLSNLICAKKVSLVKYFKTIFIFFQFKEFRFNIFFWRSLILSFLYTQKLNTMRRKMLKIYRPVR
ncbi:MAG: glycosyltransferase family 2 protein [bacterium]